MSTRERKVVTVLFADLVGFTSRAEQLDPEDVEAILQPYHERLRYELERWGGTVEKFIGDAVVAFFGAPVAGEDDPERAVRAALAIRDSIAEEGKLQVRVAVNTGEALVRLGARPESGEGMAAGDVVNTAARLQSAAPANGILVGETTYRATAEPIEYREHEPIGAKGKEEPVPVWEVVAARARFGVDLAPETRTPLAARLDSLPADEKTVLQDAAVVGKVFWLGALGATEQQLHALQRKELVQRARRSSVAGETEFAFKHVLVRDVAYGQIPRADRAAKHVRTAEWIESLGRPEDHAEMLVHHYVNALELMRAAGQSLDGLATRARDALREAGDRALALSALPQAEAYYADAVALTTDGDPDRPDHLFRLGRTRFFRFDEGGEELEQAQSAFLQAGDLERAAEAALLLAQVAWRTGDRKRMRRHLDHARELVAEMPPSRIRAAVLSDASRYAMLADRNDEAIELGTAALRMAEELGLDDLRAHALNNIGSARGNSGDRRGLAELEESIAIATEINSVSDILRGKNNLTTQFVIYGELPRSRQALDELRELCERYGNLGFLRFLQGGPDVAETYQAGDWDEALARADAFLAGVEAGSPHYQAASAYGWRALMRIARNDLTGALADVERSTDLAPSVGDPQLTLTALPIAAFVVAEVGDDARSAAIFGDVIRQLQNLAHMGWSVVEACHMAFVARRLGREDELAAILAREAFDTPWLYAAEAVLAGDFVRAAEIFDEMGGPTPAAFCRLRSGAEQEVRSSLAFYRGVGATRYVREGEALLAASA